MSEDFYNQTVAPLQETDASLAGGEAEPLSPLPYNSQPFEDLMILPALSPDTRAEEPPDRSDEAVLDRIWKSAEEIDFLSFENETKAEPMHVYLGELVKVGTDSEGTVTNLHAIKSEIDSRLVDIMLGEDTEERWAESAVLQKLLGSYNPKSRLNTLFDDQKNSAKAVGHVYSKDGHTTVNNLGLPGAKENKLLTEFADVPNARYMPGKPFALEEAHQAYNDAGVAHRIVVNEPQSVEHPELTGKVGIGYTHMTGGNNEYGHMHLNQTRRGNTPFEFALFVDKHHGSEMARILEGNPELVEHFALRSLRDVLQFNDQQLADPYNRSIDSIVNPAVRDALEQTNRVHFSDRVDSCPEQCCRNPHARAVYSFS